MNAGSSTACGEWPVDSLVGGSIKSEGFGASGRIVTSSTAEAIAALAADLIEALTLTGATAGAGAAAGIAGAIGAETGVGAAAAGAGRGVSARSMRSAMRWLSLRIRCANQSRCSN